MGGLWVPNRVSLLRNLPLRYAVIPTKSSTSSNSTPNCRNVKGESASTLCWKQDSKKTGCSLAIFSSTQECFRIYRAASHQRGGLRRKNFHKVPPERSSFGQSLYLMEFPFSNRRQETARYFRPALAFQRKLSLHTYESGHFFSFLLTGACLSTALVSWSVDASMVGSAYHHHRLFQAERKTEIRSFSVGSSS